MEHYFDQCYAPQLSVGQFTYLAVSRDTPAGRPLSICQRQPVILTLYAADDLTALRVGIVALRQLRIQRLTEEAYEQGTLLTHEDLACLLNSSLSTIKRDVQALRQQGLMIPTRGQVKDIGKGVSHKRQIVQDYLAGYTFSEIERRQRHSTNSIHR
jgi:biotin operon repressor